MEGEYKDRYSLIGEWYDDIASLTRRYFVFYFPYDDSVEMFDCKNRKTFLRRTKVHGLSLDKFYIGCTVNILGRLVKIVDYACEDTRKKRQKSMEVTFAIIKPLSVQAVNDILSEVTRNGFKIGRLKRTKLKTQDVDLLCQAEKAKSIYPFLIEYMTSAEVMGVEVVGPDVLAGWTRLVGDEDPSLAAPGTLRARHGTSPVQNAIYYYTDRQEIYKMLEYFFPIGLNKGARLLTNPVLRNCSLCLVKPHAYREGRLSDILIALDNNGFDITAMSTFQVEAVNASEFYEVYKGIVTEFKAMCDELVSGLCVAMEVVCRDSTLNSAVQLRKLVGPADPEIARLLRPNTLRALYGVDKVQNAVHCSDLPEDGLLEVEYFFKILSL